MFLSHRRGVRGYLAISRGLVAVGAGDRRAAARAASEAERHRAGRAAGAAAQRPMRAAVRRPRRRRTRVPRDGGARRHQAARPARPVHRGAAAQGRSAPRAPTPRRPPMPRRRSAGPDRRCSNSAAPPATGPAALAALDRNSRYGLIDKNDYKRQRAVLLTARALAAADGDRDRARSLALDALEARADARSGGRACRPAARRGRRIAPRQPDHREGLGAPIRIPTSPTTYAHLRPGDSARERLARVQTLALKAPGPAQRISRVRWRWRGPRSMRRSSRWRGTRSRAAARRSRRSGSRP